MLNQDNYQEHIKYLRESFRQISKYSNQLGYSNISVKRILKDLYNPDPFVCYQASLAASSILDQNTVTH